MSRQDTFSRIDDTFVSRMAFFSSLLSLFYFPYLYLVCLAQQPSFFNRVLMAISGLV